MRKVTIMSGVSGSGKGTYIERTFPHIWNPMLSKGDIGGTVVVSADHYFMKEGVYVFDPSKLGDAHGGCFLYFIEILQKGFYTEVVVDNTNTTVMEIAPYMLAAQAFGWEAEIITLSIPDPFDVENYARKCAARNGGRAPLQVVLRQCNNLIHRDLPPWWKNTEIETK